MATRFAVAQVFALGWLGVSVWLSLAWLRELGAAIGLVPAVIRRNRLGFFAFVIVYQMLMSPISVAGYAQELLGLRRRWK